MTRPEYVWKPDRDTAADLLADPGTTATTLIILISKALEPECPVGLDPFHLLFGCPDQNIDPMDPIEIWQDLEEFYRSRICEANENRVNAMLLAMRGNVFETDAEAFMAICNALADGDLGDMLDGVFELPQVDEMWWALLEVTLARGEMPEFSPEVLKAMENIAAGEDENEEPDNNLVAIRFDRMVDELTALGAPATLVESIKRHAGLE